MAAVHRSSRSLRDDALVSDEAVIGAGAKTDHRFLCCGVVVARTHAMNAAALRTYEIIRREGSQREALASMQTRAELYKYLDYHAYEQRLDRLFAADRDRKQER